jgi:hypothetical protein
MKYLKLFLSGIACAMICVALYIFVLQKLCWSPAFYCGIYNWFTMIITVYGNFIMHFIRPDCVSGGPDDCIGPAFMIMSGTLFVIGVIGGWLVFF